jgi:hypothetical protein
MFIVIHEADIFGAVQLREILTPSYQGVMRVVCYSSASTFATVAAFVK